MTNEYKIDSEEFDPQSRFDNLDKFEEKFWEKKKLDEMSQEEWELICDGCGKCCLNKLEIREKIRNNNKIEIKNTIHFTNTHCRFLDCNNCACKIYENRLASVDSCRDITIEAVREKPRWLPKTCAYWLLDNGEKLPSWHPLISKKIETVHQAKMSVRDRDCVTEVGVKDYEDHIVEWEDL